MSDHHLFSLSLAVALILSLSFLINVFSYINVWDYPRYLGISPTVQYVPLDQTPRVVVCSLSIRLYYGDRIECVYYYKLLSN